MTFKTNRYVILTFFALLMMFSCDDEQLDANVHNTVETLLPNSDLASLMEDMTTVDNFECVDFQYPVFFTLYDLNFQNIETVTIQSDESLFAFLQNMSTDDEVVMASINFPVTLLYGNGTNIEVNNNQELEAAIMVASDACGASDGCTIENVTSYLNNCSHIPTLNGYTPSLTSFEFSENNGLFTMYELDLPYSGTWDISMIEGEIQVVITFNGLESFNGEWIVTDCQENVLTLQQGEDILRLAQECNTNGNPLECLESVDMEITVCDELADSTEIFDLTQVFANCTADPSFIVSYFQSLQDAQTNSNQLSNPASYTNISNPQIIYVRVEFEGISYPEIYELNLILENCDCNNPGTLTNDLVLYMPFSEQVKDLISGQVISGVSNSYVTDRDGNPSCAISFDGTNDFSFPISTANQLVQGDNFSVSIWLKMQNTEVADLETIFQKGTVNNEGFQIAVFDLNTPLVSDTTNGYGLWDNDWNQEVDVQWENTDWHHLVVTRDSNNTIRLYRDGSLRSMDENSNFDIDSSPLENYVLGQFFNGHLDDLRVYKRTLSPNEVTVLYNLAGDCNQCL